MNKRAWVSKRCKTFKTLVPSPRERKFTGKTMAPLPRIDTLLIIWPSISSKYIQGGICRKTICFSRQNNLRYYLPAVGAVAQAAVAVASLCGPLAAIPFGLNSKILATMYLPPSLSLKSGLYISQISYTHSLT